MDLINTPPRLQHSAVAMSKKTERVWAVCKRMGGSELNCAVVRPVATPKRGRCGGVGPGGEIGSMQPAAGVRECRAERRVWRSLWSGRVCR